MTAAKEPLKPSARLLPSSGRHDTPEAQLARATAESPAMPALKPKTGVPGSHPFTASTSLAGKLTRCGLPNSESKITTRSRAAIPATKPRCPRKGPPVTRARPPGRNRGGGSGNSTTPFFSLPRNSSITRSGIRAGRSPSITSLVTPGAVPAACHWRSIVRKRYPGKSGRRTC